MPSRFRVPQGADHADAALRHGRDAGASAGIRPDAARPCEAAARTRGAAAAKFASRTTWTKRSAMPTSSSPRVGAAWTPWAANPTESLRIAKQYKHWICNAERMKLAAARCSVHAPAARRSRQRSDRRGHRWPALGGVPGSGKPPAHRQGDYGADHGGAAKSSTR